MSTQPNLLDAARATIDQVDRQMAELFCRRMEAVRQVAEYKKQAGIPVLDRDREAAILAKNAALVQDEQLRAYYINYLRYNMALSRKYQHALLQGQRVAYSGVPGAFADIAAARIFPDGVRVPCADFKAAYDAVVQGECECAVLPVENSTHGDVSAVLDMAFSGSLYVSGLYDLEIEQCLLAVPGTDISRIRSVSSQSELEIAVISVGKDLGGLTVHQADNIISGVKLALKVLVCNDGLFKILKYLEKLLVIGLCTDNSGKGTNDKRKGGDY